MLVDLNGPVDDPWVELADDVAAPAAGHVVITPERWQAERDAWRAFRGRVGIVLTPDHDVEACAQDLDGAALVVLEFPSFVDGRHYSNAVLLRERFAYRGELRASGDVGRDQLFYLLRCGFDTFALPPGTDPTAFLRGASDFSCVYQYAVDARTPVARYRGAFV